MRMRITKTKYYIMSKQIKDSFGNWTAEPVSSIVTGHKAANERTYITDEFNPTFITGEQSYELHDGHIGGHRPITTSIREALAFLDNNKFSQVSLLS